MNWLPIKLSNIDAISYDPSNEILSVRFHKSGIYHYHDVPQYLIDQMLEAESVGKYFAQNIKDKFDFEKEISDEPV